MSHNIFDSTFNGMGGSEFYRAQVTPELFPHQKPMRVDNWTDTDREMFCGGEFAKPHGSADSGISK